MALRITRCAAAHISNVLRVHPLEHWGVLFSVKSGGCSGFEYAMEVIPKLSSRHEEVPNEYNINVAIDSMSVFHMLGTTIDYSEGIMGQRLEFHNPNATNMCGCGKSFH